MGKLKIGLLKLCLGVCFNLLHAVTCLPRSQSCAMCFQVAMQFITLYSYDDVVTANIEGSSGSVWRISPPSRHEVIKELLESPVDVTLRLAWNFQRLELCS